MISKQLKNIISLIMSGILLSGLCIAQNSEKVKELEKIYNEWDVKKQ